MFQPTSADIRRARATAITRLGISFRVWSKLMLASGHVTLHGSRLPAGRRVVGAAELLARAEMESCVQETVHGRPTGCAPLVLENLLVTHGEEFVQDVGWLLENEWAHAAYGGVDRVAEAAALAGLQAPDSGWGTHRAECRDRLEAAGGATVYFDLLREVFSPEELANG